MPCQPTAEAVLDASDDRPPTLRGRCRVVTVDGQAGAGKTTLAEQVARAAEARRVDVELVHLDDLYRGWRGVLTIGTEVERLLRTLHDSGAAAYRRYDWHLEAYAEEHRVDLPDLLVIEGVGCSPVAADDLVTLRIWVEAPREVRLRRGLERDGEHLREQWLQFLVDEDEVHRRDRTRERADVVVDGTTGEVRVSADDRARDPRGPR